MNHQHRLAVSSTEGQSSYIIVTVLGVSGDTVRLGIERPRGVPVELGEVYAELVQAAGKPEFSS